MGLFTPTGKDLFVKPEDIKNGTVDQFLQGLAKKESSGNYKALGPVINSGMYTNDRAYGKYQIMGKNVPEWSQKYLGKKLTADQLYQDEKLQDELMRKRAQELYSKYGNWEDVASVHFTGQPLKKAGNVKDQLGTTAPKYVQDVLAFMRGDSPAVKYQSPLTPGMAGSTPAMQDQTVWNTTMQNIGQHPLIQGPLKALDFLGTTIDKGFGLPGKATGALMTGQWNDNGVPDTFSGQVEEATTGLTGSPTAGAVAGLLGSIAQPMPGPGKARKVEALADIIKNAKPLNLFHGSNAKFDKFDMGMAGKGEGADLFGKGAYLTDSEELAKFYALNTSKKQFIEKYTPTGILGTEEPVFKKGADEMAKKIATVNQFVGENLNLLDVSTYKVNDKIIKEFAKAFEAMGMSKADALSEVMRKVDYARKNSSKINNYRGELEYLVRQIPGGSESMKNISEILKKEGYDGLKYASDKSFEGTKGTNYVIYNPEKLSVAGKNTASSVSEMIKKQNVAGKSKAMQTPKGTDFTIPKLEGENIVKTNKIPDVLYHGTIKENAKSLLKNGFDTSKNKKGYAEAPDAFYTSKNAGNRSDHSAGTYGESILEVRPKDKSTLVVLSGKGDMVSTGKARGGEDGKFIREELRKAGVDAIDDGSGEFIILNPDKFTISKGGKPISNQEAFAMGALPFAPVGYDQVTKAQEDQNGKETIQLNPFQPGFLTSSQTVSKIDPPTQPPAFTEDKKRAFQGNNSMNPDGLSRMGLNPLIPGGSKPDSGTPKPAPATNKPFADQVIKPVNQTYSLRDNKIQTNDEELRQLGAVLFGEMGIRTDKLELEAGIIANTILNRSENRGKSIQEILSQPYQYQAYNDGQYKAYMDGKPQKSKDPVVKAQVEAVNKVLDQIKNGTLENKYGKVENYSHFYRDDSGKELPYGQYPIRVYTDPRLQKIEEWKTYSPKTWAKFSKAERQRIIAKSKAEKLQYLGIKTRQLTSQN